MLWNLGLKNVNSKLFHYAAGLYDAAAIQSTMSNRTGKSPFRLASWRRTAQLAIQTATDISILPSLPMLKNCQIDHFCCPLWIYVRYFFVRDTFSCALGLVVEGEEKCVFWELCQPCLFRNLRSIAEPPPKCFFLSAVGA